MDKNLEQASEIIKKGGIVIFPTDTVFGIGCRIDYEKSVARLFEIRKRPHYKAVPVLVSSIEMAEEYVDKIDPEVRFLMDKYWPGGLTIVLKCRKEKIPSPARGGGDTIGIRMPNHKTLLKLIKKVGVPILAPSANFSGGLTPLKISDLDPKLVELVDYVILGRCTIKQSSTVVDCTKMPFKILRDGAVKVSF